MNKTKYICTTALGIALYAALSLSIKFPLGVGHLALDLGYIVLGVYAYCFGPVPGAIVGACGAGIISALTGWFAPGWVLGNLLVGAMCGAAFQRDNNKMASVYNLIMAWVAVFLGIAVIKTVVECTMYSIPLAIKGPKNLVATLADGIVMSIGVLLAPKMGRIRKIS